MPSHFMESTPNLQVKSMKIQFNNKQNRNQTNKNKANKRTNKIVLLGLLTQIAFPNKKIVLRPLPDQRFISEYLDPHLNSRELNSHMLFKPVSNILSLFFQRY